MEAFTNAYSCIALPAPSGGSLVEPNAMAVDGLYFAPHHPVVTSRINFSPIPHSPPPVPKVAMRISWDLRRLAPASPTVINHLPLAVSRVVQEPVPMAGPSTASPSIATPSTAGPSSLPTAAPSTSTAPAGPSRIIIIPKPAGEPGRPGSGGFSLEGILQNTYNWTKQDVETLLAYIRREATRTLRLNASYRSQNQALITKICDKAMDADHWPVLTNYDNCWPVRSALKLILKYKSEASRRVEGKRMATRIRDAISNREKSHESSSSDEA